MPLIRYDIGDMAVVGPKKCRCGNMLPTLRKITGRVMEHFITKSGAIIPGEFFVHLIGVVYNRGLVKKFQVIQMDYDKIKILVVPNGEISGSFKNEINDKIRVVMGSETKIIWEIVDEIPKTPSGKYLYTISYVWKSRM